MRTVKCVIDGKEVKRRVDYIEPDMDFPGDSREVPILRPGEDVLWVSTDSRPQIVKLQDDA